MTSMLDETQADDRATRAAQGLRVFSNSAQALASCGTDEAGDVPATDTITPLEPNRRGRHEIGSPSSTMAGARAQR